MGLGPMSSAGVAGSCGVLQQEQQSVASFIYLFYSIFFFFLPFLPLLRCCGLLRSFCCCCIFNTSEPPTIFGLLLETRSSWLVGQQNDFSLLLLFLLNFQTTNCIHACTYIAPHTYALNIYMRVCVCVYRNNTCIFIKRRQRTKVFAEMISM